MGNARSFVRAAAVSAVAAAVVAAGNTAPTGSTILIGASHGGLLTGSVAAPVALGTGTFLVASVGPDGSVKTADDETLLVTGTGGGSASAAALATPFLSDYSGHALRLSATRAAVIGAGPDGSWSTADDVVHILDGIGSSNTVTSVTIGGLDKSDANAPVALDTDTFVVGTRGPDNVANTADDRVVMVTLGGESPILTNLSTPRVPKAGRSRPVALSPDSFLVTSNGTDGADNSGDDLVYLFTDVHGTPIRTDLSVPNNYKQTGGPVRVNARRAILAASGPDASNGSADDVLWLLDDLGGANTLTPIPTGSQWDYGAGVPTVLADDLAVISSNGPDETDGTFDDSLVVISGLGTTNTVTTITIGVMDEDGECRPVRVGPDSCAFVAFGEDGNQTSADDEVILVTGVGAANTVHRIVVPGLRGGITSKIVPVGPDSLLVMASGGSSGSVDGVVLVTDALGTPVVETTGFDAGGGVDDTYNISLVPVVLGGGVAVHVSQGADGEIQTTDDSLRVLSGLPETRSLFVKSAKVGFSAEKPEKGEKAVLKGVLSLADAGGIRDDVTITLGNASTTIPLTAFTVKNGTWKYRAPKGSPGFVTAVTYSGRKGNFSVKAKGLASGAETTDPDHLALSFESGEAFFGEVVTGTAYKGGIKYKAPK